MSGAESTLGGSLLNIHQAGTGVCIIMLCSREWRREG